MSALGSIELLAFDAYGTLFDVHSVTATAERLFPGEGAALSATWRSRQLEYTWLQSLMQRRRPFSEVTRLALDQAAAMRGLALDQAARESLLDQYLRLEAFPDVPGALAKLADVRKIVLSNGTRAMLEPLLEHCGLAPHFEAVVSVDEVDRYKPDPAVYALVAARTGVPAARSALVSSNCWDAIGAGSYGMASVWVNRTGAPPDRHGPPPDVELGSLRELPALLAARAR